MATALSGGCVLRTDELLMFVVLLFVLLILLLLTIALFALILFCNECVGCATTEW